MDQIYKLSGGIPRLINVLCDRALLGAYTEDKLQIDKKIIRKAANEVLADEFQQSQARRRPGLLAGGAVVLIIASVFLYMYWQQPELNHAPDQTAIQPAPELSKADALVDKPPPQESVAQPPGTVPDVTALSSPDTGSVSLAATLAKANESWSLAAWTELFALWSVNLPAAVEPEFCVFARDMGLSCLVEQGSWGLLRQYNRPVIMKLLANDGRTVPVILQHLDDGVAELKIGAELLRLAIGEVDRYWLGEFTLLLKSPPSGHLLLKAGDRNADVAWLRQLLEITQQVKLPAIDPQYFDSSLLQHVMDFQRSQGLTPDGVVGKQTLIQLNTYTSGHAPLLSVESS